MATDVTPDILVGVITPDPRLTFAAAFDDANSTSNAGASALTQASPLPGSPVAQDNTGLTITAVGTQLTGSEVRVRTLQGGYPDTDGARFAWRNNGDSLWRGWNPPYMISGFVFVDRNTTANYWRHFHAVTLASGKVLAVAVRESRYIYAATRATGGLWGTPVEVYDKGTTYTYNASPTVCVLPNGRILCFFLRERGTNATVRMHYSDDDGATWTEGSRACLPASFATGTYVPKRIRCAYLDGQISLILQLTNAGTTDELHQYASDDLGATFSLVLALVGATNVDYGYHDIIAYQGVLLVAYLKGIAGPTVLPYVRRLGSAFEPLSSPAEVLATSAANAMEWGTVSANIFTDGELAMWADDDGSLWVVGRDFDTAGGALSEVMVARSGDGGDTWVTVSDSSAANGTGAAVWYARDATTYPKELCAVAVHGSTLLIHRASSAAGAADDSFCQTVLGGFTTVEMPELDALDLAMESKGAWELTWLPFENLDVTGPGSGTGHWAKTTAGSPTISMTTNGQTITHTTGADSVVWSTVPATNGETIAIAQILVNTSGPTGYLQVQVTDAVNFSSTVRIEVTPTQIIFYDEEGGANIVTPVTTTAGLNGVQVKIASSDVAVPTVSGWYRQLGTDQEWIAIATNTTVTKGTLTVAHINVGTRPGVGSSFVSIRLVAATWGTYAGVGLSGGQQNPEELLGRSYMPTPVYVDAGTRIVAEDGPTFRNDEWHVDTRYTYGIEQAHTEVSPSPSKEYRTTDETEHDIVWTIDSTTAEEALDQLYGIYLGAINFRTASVWGQASGGAWTQLAAIDGATGASGLGFVRAGGTIRVNTSSSGNGADYYPKNTLAGSYFGMSATVIRKIAGNTSGSWVPTATGTTRLPTLQLTDYAGADPASGTTAGFIIPKEVVVMWSVAPGTTYKAYRLRIAAQSTYEGYFKIGACVLGPATIFGQRWGLGRAATYSPANETTEGPAGTRSVRTLFGGRRALEVDWTEGVFASPIYGDAPVVDYIRAYDTSGPIVAAPEDTAHTLTGFMEGINGAAGLVVPFIRYNVPASNTAVTMTNRDTFLYGRLVSETVRRDTVSGNEWDATNGEFVRVTRWRFEEEK